MAYIVPPLGVAVDLPASVSTVELRIGTFNTAVKIDAFNATGALVTSVTAPDTNTFANISVDGPALNKLVLSEGGYEGLLARACVDLVLAS